MDFEKLIIALVDDGVPVANLLRLDEMSVSTTNAIISMLMKGTSNIPEEQAQLVEDAQSTLEILRMADILNIDGPQVTPGKVFPEFKEFAADFFNMDNTIIRCLGISRQEFDEIKREYVSIITETREFGGILKSWQELSPEVRFGIVRGIFIQRGIMANIVGNATKSIDSIAKYCRTSSEWLRQWTIE
jgi:hypothetical protein